jgi:hypothetical protein
VTRVTPIMAMVPIRRLVWDEWIRLGLVWALLGGVSRRVVGRG